MPLLREFYQTTNNQCKVYSREIASDNQLKEKVAWLLDELIESYGYQVEWLGSRIKPLDAIRINDEEFIKLGIYTEDGAPFIVIVLTALGKLKQGLAKLRNEIIDLNCTNTGFATDGTTKGTAFIRRKQKSNEFDYLVDIEAYKRPLSETNYGVYGVSSKSGKSNFQFRSLEPLSTKVENVFYEAHSHIRDIDGLHADEALDELSKVIYAKLFDEDSVKRNAHYRAQRWIYGNSEECATAIRELYNEANEYDMRVFSLHIPGYKRSRGVFNQPINLSSAAIAKVIETFERFDISGSSLDVKGRAFQKVFLPALRAGMGQYFTPVPVVDFMVEVMAPNVSDLILDPFAGSGHFLSTSITFVKKYEARKELINEFMFHKLHGIEKSERMVRIAMTDMRLHGDGHSNMRCTDALLAFENYIDIEPGTFDIVMTNPPFGSILGKEALDQLGSFELREGSKKIPLEVLGLERSIQFLRPGGRLGIVLPESIFVNSSSLNVRNWIKEQLCVRAIVSLPIETFSPFGANIKTSILFGRKWLPGEDKKREYRVFMGLIQNVGYDASGKEKQDMDIGIMAKEVKDYLMKEGW